MSISQMILQYVITLILGGVVGFLTTQLKSKNKKNKALEDAVKALLKDRLIERYRELKEKGEISILDKENLEEMFNQYENLDGNGTVGRMVKELLDSKTKIVN